MSDSPPFHVLSFESRRAAEMAQLIERHGGQATVVPSMRVLPLAENRTAIAFAQALIAGEVDLVLFTTGIGTELLFETVQDQGDWEAFRSALERTRIIARGPKPAAVLAKRGFTANGKTPPPHTGRETLALLEQEELTGKVVAIQEYGRPNRELIETLERLGARVMPVPVYRWGLPEETGEIEAAIDQVIAGRFDACLLTSAQQLGNVLAVAERTGRQEALRAALPSCVLGSIGPTCSAEITASGFAVDLEADPPKMGVLVRRVLEEGPVIRQRKQET